MGRLCGGAHEISGIKAPLFLHEWSGGWWDRDGGGGGGVGVVGGVGVWVGGGGVGGDRGWWAGGGRGGGVSGVLVMWVVEGGWVVVWVMVC